MNESPADDLTFEQALAALETIVRELEDGQTGLEEALGHYETGVGLLRRCYARLTQAEQRIVALAGLAEDGQPILQPFLHAATTDPEPRRRRKKLDESEP